MDMMKRKYSLILIVMGISIIYLAGCKNNSTVKPIEVTPILETESVENGIMEEETDTDALPEENEREAEEEPEQKETESETDNTPKEAPKLPNTGKKIEDFIPEDWELLDSIEMDFNEDGISDYVGVLEPVLIDMGGYWMHQRYPRILFAIAGDGTEGYCLDFQDVNSIRTSDEGGVFGDPYQPLTAEGTSFTTHAYGGSAWRWSEDRTYTYRQGTWWLTASEDTYGYYEHITSYHRNDWESGTGIRKERSSEFDDMEENWESTEYDVVYEVPLGDPMTLEQAGKRWWLAPERVTDWEVKETVFAAGVEPVEGEVKLPGDAYVGYCDEDCMLYAFTPNPDTSRRPYYLVRYRWQDKVLSVLAKEESAIDDLQYYNGKIYYSSEIVENVAYKTMQDGEEQIAEKEETVGIRLNRIEVDGTGKETVFEYRYEKPEQEIVENGIPYLAFNYEISRDEIFAEVYVGNEPHPFYRMKTDGSECLKIGQMPKQMEKELVIENAGNVIYPASSDIMDSIQAGNWVYFRYMIEETYNGDTINYPALFRYQTDELIAKRVNQRACYSFEIVGDCVYYLDGTISVQDHGELYVSRLDGENERLLADELHDFQIADEKYIYYTYRHDTVGAGLEGHALHRMNLDGSDSMVAAYEVSGIDMCISHFDYKVEDGWVDCGTFKMELGEPANGYEKIVFKDIGDNEWVYYVTNRLMKARKDGSERVELDGEDDYYYEIEKMEDGWIYYIKGGEKYKIREDGSGNLRFAEK